jgi:hypothetical protein
MDRRLFLKGVVPHRCTTIANTAQTPDLRIAYGGIGIECSTYSRADDRARQEVRMNAPRGQGPTRARFARRLWPFGPPSSRPTQAIRTYFLRFVSGRASCSETRGIRRVSRL